MPPSPFDELPHDFVEDLLSWVAPLARMSAAHPDLSRILRVIGRLQDRPYRTHCLLTGEPGTGKEGLARLLHRLMHPGGGPVELVSTLGLSEAELGLALFGASPEDAGAIGRARGGTLVLDELLALSPSLQRRLHELLRRERRPADFDQGSDPDKRVVVVALTDGDLPAAVAAGRFRHDLYHRLGRIVLNLPPLRERQDDLLPAALWTANRLLRQGDHGRGQAQGISRSAELLGQGISPLSPGAFQVLPEAIEALRQHPFLGNFRELEAVMERAIFLYSDGERLTGTDVQAALA